MDHLIIDIGSYIQLTRVLTDTLLSLPIDRKFCIEVNSCKDMLFNVFNMLESKIDR